MGPNARNHLPHRHHQLKINQNFDGVHSFFFLICIKHRRNLVCGKDMHLSLLQMIIKNIYQISLTFFFPFYRDFGHHYYHHGMREPGPGPGPWTLPDLLVLCDPELQS